MRSSKRVRYYSEKVSQPDEDPSETNFDREIASISEMIDHEKRYIDKRM